MLYVFKQYVMPFSLLLFLFYVVYDIAVCREYDRFRYILLEIRMCYVLL